MAQGIETDGTPPHPVKLREIGPGLFIITEAGPLPAEERPVTRLYEIAKQLLQPEASSGLARIVAWFEENEKRQPFWSAKLLRDKVFRKDPVLQESFQHAIDTGIIETYKVDNPKNPAFPTTAVRLNREHPHFRQKNRGATPAFSNPDMSL